MRPKCVGGEMKAYPRGGESVRILGDGRATRRANMDVAEIRIRVEERGFPRSTLGISVWMAHGWNGEYLGQGRVEDRTHYGWPEPGAILVGIHYRQSG